MLVPLVARLLKLVVHLVHPPAVHPTFCRRPPRLPVGTLRRRRRWHHRPHPRRPRNLWNRFCRRNILLSKFRWRLSTLAHPDLPASGQTHSVSWTGISALRGSPDQTSDPPVSQFRFQKGEGIPWSHSGTKTVKHFCLQAKSNLFAKTS